MPVVHCVVQPPQCSGSVAVSTHVPPHIIPGSPEDVVQPVVPLSLAAGCRLSPQPNVKTPRTARVSQRMVLSILLHRAMTTRDLTGNPSSRRPGILPSPKGARRQGVELVHPL
jgi:hypothetical protein